MLRHLGGNFFPKWARVQADALEGSICRRSVRRRKRMGWNRTPELNMDLCYRSVPMKTVQVRPSFGWLLLAVSILFCATASGQQEVPDFYPDSWYRIAVDANGTMVEGDGHGYDGGTWYYYPETGWFRQWFYNGSYDPTRQGELEYKAYITPGPSLGPTNIELQFNWANPQWSALGLGRPPLPGDVPTAGDESNYIATESFHSTGSVSNFESIEPNRELTIDNYNPEWTCIAIRGTNFRVYRWAIHRCISQEATQGAWCNYQTGDCYIGTEGEGTASYTWLGAGSTCQACTVKPPESLDFGDAPEPSYPTLLTHNGARHTIVAGVCLGQTVDAETNGQPDATATGDDNDGTDDEDGVIFTSTIEPGKIASIEVTASVQGYLNAWIDFDGDGSFGGADEQIFRDELLGAGVSPLAFAVPDAAPEGATFARFRFSTRGLLGYEGLASDGEVEDYRVTIVAGFEPQPTSGLNADRWNQPPSLVDPADPYTFNAFTVLSSFGLHQIAADDCQFQDNQPITGIHWWGSFDGWTQPHLPATLPLAFHIGIWSDVPDSQPSNASTFSHPGTLLWNAYSLTSTWAVAGRQQGEKGSETGPTVFQFSQALSQDQWFYPNAGSASESPESTFFWVSIAAIYDTAAAEPEYPWGWISRTHESSAAATIVHEITPADLSPWPPTLGAQWSIGTLVQDGTKLPLDMAYQLTTYQSPYPDADAGASDEDSETEAEETEKPEEKK